MRNGVPRKAYLIGVDGTSIAATIGESMKRMARSGVSSTFPVLSLPETRSDPQSGIGSGMQNAAPHRLAAKVPALLKAIDGLLSLVDDVDQHRGRVIVLNDDRFKEACAIQREVKKIVGGKESCEG